MRALIQRVSRASVSVEGGQISSIGWGLLVLLGIARDDSEAQGINDRLQLASAEAELRKRINEGWLRAGVTMVDPERTPVGPRLRRVAAEADQQQRADESDSRARARTPGGALGIQSRGRFCHGYAPAAARC